MNPSRSKLSVYEAADGWRWRLRRYGRIVAESGEAYASKRNAVRAADAVVAAVKASPTVVVEV